MSSRVKLSVCIPAYNRAEFLSPLLDSILAQDYSEYNIVICEDSSPQRSEIAEIVKRYQANHPDKIAYHENENNLGYDGNIRELVAKAPGEYCVFMGNDDLMTTGALSAIARTIEQTPDCGVVVRSYATFDTDQNQHKQVFRYFPERKVFEAGKSAIAVAYRRSVVIPGMVIHRDSAQAIATNQFDGTLLYQLYLVGMICSHKPVVFEPTIVALRRDGTPPDFGNSASEQGKFVPKEQTPESSIHFMQGMLTIADHIEQETKLKVADAIKDDICAYIYPILSIQAHQSKRVFMRYSYQLIKLGLARNILFYVYLISLLVLGATSSDNIIKFIKSKLGYTPMLSKSLK